MAFAILLLKGLMNSWIISIVEGVGEHRVPLLYSWQKVERQANVANE